MFRACKSGLIDTERDMCGRLTVVHVHALHGEQTEGMAREYDSSVPSCVETIVGTASRKQVPSGGRLQVWEKACVSKNAPLSTGN
jgi:hypothetical protein